MVEQKRLQRLLITCTYAARATYRVRYQGDGNRERPQPESQNLDAWNAYVLRTAETRPAEHNEIWPDSGGPPRRIALCETPSPHEILSTAFARGGPQIRWSQAGVRRSRVFVPENRRPQFPGGGGGPGLPQSAYLRRLLLTRARPGLTRASAFAGQRRDAVPALVQSTPAARCFAGVGKPNAWDGARGRVRSPMSRATMVETAAGRRQQKRHLPSIAWYINAINQSAARSRSDGF